MIIIKESKNTVFHLSKVTKELFKIIAFITIGIAIFEVSLQIKFVADKIQSGIIFLLAIIVVIILYRKFISYIKKYKVIDNKYLHPIPMSWKIKVLIITFGYAIASSLEVILTSQTKSCNQNTIEKNEVNLYTSIFESGITAPIIEEIIFRGVLFVTLLIASSFLFKRSKKKHDFLGTSTFFVFSSLLFSYMHVAKCTDIEHIGDYLASGIVLTLVFIMTRDIKLPIIIHMIINITSILNRYDYNFISGSIEVIMFVTALIYFIRIATINKSKTRKSIINYGYYYSYKIDKYLAKRKIKKLHNE